MEFALYRYEFELIDPSTLPFEHGGFDMEPQEAFARKRELLDELLAADFEAGGKLRFTNKRGNTLYHHHVAAPKDGMALIELANFSTVSHRPHPFASKKKEDNYESCHIIIDNRAAADGDLPHQRAAIEVRPSAFKTTDIVASAIARGLTTAFSRHGLQVKVVPRRDDREFWRIVGDQKQYPKGFRSLRVEFPQINDPEVTAGLSRLQLDAQREMFGSDLVLVQTAPPGQRFPFDENDARQRLYIEVCTDIADSISIYPIGAHKFTFGAKYARTAQLPDTQIEKIAEAAQSGNLFGADRLQSVKNFMNNAY